MSNGLTQGNKLIIFLICFYLIYVIDGIEDYYEYCVQEKRNAYEILFDFNSVKMPLEYLVEGVGFIKPREYSISSYSAKIVCF